jgi:hypothetical protein
MADIGIVVMTLGALLLLAIRLAAAYRLYLRVPHAVAAAVASQVIVWLVLLKFTLDCPWFPLN